ncbi:DEAD/DEAH box helicase family protein [Ureaplasma sp. ES3154-GEN]|uniref:DEAD/DEAH box helicase family protein n=1 Tax=Ureaplasma sp. ES3154-GEN TaxID=2984844 RepID=UPI0021E705C5|nr:DEAD/DEAH box helicase family protein [Ureaplasma sp. ES3154-GEN]MCV3743698.1 DEAD/DEAH box helicase family protein [Ureaplasma sp. ES3154-GEN]
MKLTSVQEQAVKQLLSHFNYAYLQQESKIIEFKAPTGSGKTFMMANFIDWAITTNKQKNKKPLLFVIMTLSNAELPKQMEDNFNEYNSYLQNRHEIIFERKESPSSTKNNAKDADYSFKPQPNKVFILGASSFGAKKIYTEQGILDKFINEIANHYFVVFIRDEAHVGTSEKKDNKDTKNFYKKMSKIANFQINMTATPNNQYEQVKITENELKKDDIKLLKTVPMVNKGVDNTAESVIDDDILLNIACKEFKKIKKRYASEEGLMGKINPAMLIQVSDKQAEKSDEFEVNIRAIIKKLESYNFTYAKYFASEKISSNLRGQATLKEVSKRNSDIDVIIFKVGPATGWNIPRACMLVQLRKVSSENLTAQTLGRIKRNPDPNFNFKTNSWAYKYWVYSNFTGFDKLFKDCEIKTYKLNIDSVDNLFYYGEINKEVAAIAVDDNLIVKYIQNHLFGLLKSSYDFYKKEVAAKKFLIGKSTKISRQDYVTEKINNTIELSVYINNFFEKTSNIFTQSLINKINNYFDTLNEFTPLLWYTLIKDLYPKIKNYIATQRKELIDQKNIREFKFIYDKKLPAEINLLTNDDHQTQFKESALNFKYELVHNLNKKTKNNKSKTHSFDSENEVFFIEAIKKLFMHNEAKYANIAIYRNTLSDGLSYDYYDANFNIHQQFPDFILIYKTNKIEHQISIEIKDYNNDNDENKTNNIIQSYKSYYQLDNRKSTPVQIVSSLLLQVNQKHNDDNKFFIAGGGSTNDDIDNEIQNNKNINKSIQWVYDLIKQFKPSV